MSEHGLGRLFIPDQRDNDYHVRTLLATVPTPPERNWRYYGDWKYYLDQGSTPMCVEYAWHHWLLDGPITEGAPPLWDFGDVYHRAQEIDEYPGTDYEGTSVRAGAEVLKEMGFIESYHWAWDLDSVIDAIIFAGPVVMGTNWYNDMMETDKNGYVHPTGGLAGGHAWELTGASRTRGVVRGKNSWSREWGKFGHFWMTFEELEKLINEDGEACLAVELKRHV